MFDGFDFGDWDAGEIKDLTDIEKEIDNLTKQLLDAKKVYYTSSDSIMSDYEFDSKLRHLEELEKEYPQFKHKKTPTEIVGSDPDLNLFDNIAHIKQMFSLSDVFDYNELKEWYDRFLKDTKTKEGELEFSAEGKIDGVAVDLVYQNGELVRAASRGDGVVGESILDNVLTMECIPRLLHKSKAYIVPKLLEIRGEIYMPLQDFVNLNLEIETENLNFSKKDKPIEFANPRNAANGTVRQLNIDSIKDQKRVIKFYAHGIGAFDGPWIPKTQSEYYLALEEWGIPVSKNRKIIRNFKDFVSFIEQLLPYKEKYDSVSESIEIDRELDLTEVERDLVQAKNLQKQKKENDDNVQISDGELQKLLTSNTNNPNWKNFVNKRIDKLKNIEIPDECEHGIDGVVFKANLFSVQNELGETQKYPRWAIAYKFPPPSKWTELLAINYEVGKTGRLTPLASLKPVKLQGSTIAKATLNNFDEIERKDIRIGGKVRVIKSGDIIPKIIEVAKNKEFPKYVRPQVCPSCGAELVLDTEDSADLRCSDPEHCVGQLKQRLKYIVSRSCFDIQALGIKNIESLVGDDDYDTETKFVKNVMFDLLNNWEGVESEQRYIMKSESELFDLTYSKLVTVPALSTKNNLDNKTVNEILKQIEKAKTQPLWRVLLGLNILRLGKSAAQKLSKKFNDLDSIKDASIEDISEISGVGEVLGENVWEFFHTSDNQWRRDILEGWLNSGLRIEG
ncbi:MAG: hypothetical protein LBM13_04945 [Candidatus Ancillula sp.]|jgi:DNA ligase (NAD+)|nr:hypothetical protein [Candidatus Ancillula sp.]